MTKLQAYRLYFPAWNAVVRRHDWRMADCRLVGKRAERFGGPEADRIYQRAWQHAEAVAQRECRAVLPDDLRHGIHVAALGRDKSSKVLTNAELDRVLAAMRVLAMPDDVDAMVKWEHPEAEERRRRVWWITHRCKPEYVSAVCRDMYGHGEVAELDDHQVGGLYATLRHRAGAKVAASGQPF